MELLLNGVVAQRWHVEGDTRIRVPLPVNASTYDTIALALDPPCPEHVEPTLACQSVALSDVSLDFAPAPAGDQTAFERGVTLLRAHVPAQAQAGDVLPVWLWWGFSQPRDANDVRFVHVTDAAGVLVAQQDTTLGAVAAGETRAELVDVALPADLPPGEYAVSVGWYSYPDITNFCILSDGACGSENVLTLGAVQVEP